MNNIHVRIFGNGPNLVLLHGWGMHSSIWTSVHERLAQYFCLHLIDLPGHGFSSSVQTDTLDKLEAITEAIAKILPADSIVCGWSLGGQVAIELALRESQRVKKLILVSTTPHFVQCKDWLLGMEFSVLELFTRNLKLDYKNTLDKFLVLQAKGSGNTRKVLRQLRASVLRETDSNIVGLQAGLQILLSTDLRKKIKYIHQPVILVHGENDFIVNLGAAQWMHEQLQDSVLISLSCCGHAPFLSHPNDFIASVMRTIQV
ncbi:MAG: pimeloyl-[acyl-carrier protein] methyl ester esterase [Nitrosomonadaceae bacterium]|nr:pimeloyl-[acyl-carrier protein] methyl ester esterase [Nitrosomonadaceae bacterium]